MEVQAMRVAHHTGRRHWVVFRGAQFLRGKADEPLNRVVARFGGLVGTPVTLIRRYRGVMRLSEAAATLADAQEEAEKEGACQA